jgi:hypothetical protein
VSSTDVHPCETEGDYVSDAALEREPT